jgi:hypothetical protein
MVTPCVYVAGPMSVGDIVVNVRNALAMGEHLRQRGFAVYVPHLTWFWPYEVAYEAWITHDLAWLARCDVMLRLPGESPGANREEAFAAQRGIPVFTSVPELMSWRTAHVIVDG